MYAHQHVLPISDLPAHKSDMGLVVDPIFECVEIELSVLGR